MSVRKITTLLSVIFLCAVWAVAQSAPAGGTAPRSATPPPGTATPPAHTATPPASTATPPASTATPPASTATPQTQQPGSVPGSNSPAPPTPGSNTQPSTV